MHAFTPPPVPDVALGESLIEHMKQAALAPKRGEGLHAYGYTRAEQDAIDILVREAVERQGMEALSDLAGNTYLIKRGKDHSKTSVIVSHPDTVEKGGAHDGRDGLGAGMAVVAGLNKAGVIPPHDICVMIARSEESCINGQVSIGAKLATGQLSPAQLHTLRNRTTGKSVFQHMDGLGIPVAQLEGRLDASPTLFPTGTDAKNLIGLLAEAHIEQGNYCAKQDISLGIVDSIRGNTRFGNATITSEPLAHDARRGRVEFTHAQIVGEAAHSGAAFEEDRADAVRTATALMARAEAWCRHKREHGGDVSFTAGAVGATNASPTTVANKATFCFGIQSRKEHLLHEFADYMQKQATELEAAATNKALRITLPKPSFTLPQAELPRITADDRTDAVRAYHKLMHKAESWYQQKRDRGYDVVYTPAVVRSAENGENVRFSFEIRSKKEHLLHEFADFMQKAAREVQAETGGKALITLPKAIISKPAEMDTGLISHAQHLSHELGIRAGVVTSGAGHDTAQFANTGSPSVMLFIRQDDPISHNPRESRRADSFAESCKLLAAMVMNPQQQEKTRSGNYASFTDYLKAQGARTYTPSP